eukprot:10734202-Alexandrium_andersonii.AAC.1
MFSTILSYICFAAVLPTRLMFGVWWAEILAQEVRAKWGQEPWAAYFEKLYMAPWISGGGVLRAALWHYGIGAPPQHGH